jgi:hypothetical protein
MAPGFFRRGHLDRDQAGAALNAREVIGDAIFGDETFVVRRARRIGGMTIRFLISTGPIRAGVRRMFI